MPRPKAWIRALAAAALVVPTPQLLSAVESIPGLAPLATGGSTGTCGQNELIASDGLASDWFGGAVDVDGDLMVIGAMNSDGVGNESGSAYVFRWTGSAWVEEKKLTASDAESAANFGASVAVSAGVIVIGAPRDGSAPDPGAAYVYQKDGVTTHWTERAKLTADGSGHFGQAVAVDFAVPKDSLTEAPVYTIAIGAYSTDSKGSVFLWESNDGMAWQAHGELADPEDQTTERFGYDVALDGDHIAIGMPYDSIDGTMPFAGAAYIGRRSGSTNTWFLETKIFSSDVAAGDQFGTSVAVSSDGCGKVIAVGEPLDNENGGDAGAVHIFHGSALTFDFRQKLVSPTPSTKFGFSIDLESTLLVVGEPPYDPPSVYAGVGAAHLFVRHDETWSPAAFAVADVEQNNDGLGTSVAVDDGAAAGDPKPGDRFTLVAGAPNTESYANSNPDPGSVSVFDLCERSRDVCELLRVDYEDGTVGGMVCKCPVDGCPPGCTFDEPLR